MQTQVFYKNDPLKSLKESIQQKHPDCSFFEHSIHNGFNIGAGFFNGQAVVEKIITDGNISLKKNIESPIIVWQNHIMTLQNGYSVSIELENASFMIDISKFGEKIQYDIHMEKIDANFLQRIVNQLFGEESPKDFKHSISFTSPTCLLLESFINGKSQPEYIDFTSGTQKKKKNRKGFRHY